MIAFLRLRSHATTAGTVTMARHGMRRGEAEPRFAGGALSPSPPLPLRLAHEFRPTRTGATLLLGTSDKFGGTDDAATGSTRPGCVVARHRAVSGSRSHLESPTTSSTFPVHLLARVLGSVACRAQDHEIATTKEKLGVSRWVRILSMMDVKSASRATPLAQTGGTAHRRSDGLPAMRLIPLDTTLGLRGITSRGHAATGYGTESSITHMDLARLRAKLGAAYGTGASLARRGHRLPARSSVEPPSSPTRSRAKNPLRLRDKGSTMSAARHMS